MTVPAYKRASKRLPSTYAFTWRELSLCLVHTPDTVNVGWSHLELTVTHPADAPLPIGFAQVYVHEVGENQLIAAGGPVAFFTAWLDRAGSAPAYARAVFQWRQGSLL